MAGTEETGNHKKLKWQKTALSLLLLAFIKLTNANATHALLRKQERW